jgi:hypothetical protein
METQEGTYEDTTKQAIGADRIWREFGMAQEKRRVAFANILREKRSE